MNQKLSILFIFLTMSIFSQEKIDIVFSSTPILDVLKKIESDFRVKFSFDSNITKEILFSLTQESCLLEELISEIEINTSLKFNQINDRYYYITIQDINKNFNLLKEVQIPNYVTSGINKNKNGSISVLPQELGVLPGLTEPDVLESLKIIPGVQSPDETASGIYIRGGTPDQNLIFWDGIKMYYSGHFFGTLSAFNPYTTKEIVLSKSGTQARYGNRVSGVIDITTEENIPKKTTGGFGFNMTHADAFFRVPISKKIAITVSGRRSFTDLLKTFTFDKLSSRVFQTFDANQERNILSKNIDFERENTFYFADFSSKIIYKSSIDETLSLSFLYTRNKLFNKFNIPFYKDLYTDNLNIKNNGISFNWKKKLSPKLTHNLKSYFSSFDLDYKANYNYIDGFLIRKSTKTNQVKDFGLSYSLNYSVNNRASFFFGYDFSSNETLYNLNYISELNIANTKSTISINQNDKGTNNTHSLFAEYLYDNNDWKINSGLRFNHFSKIEKTVIEPRLYIEKKLLDGLDFKISLEKKHQTLSQIVEFQTSRLGFDLENQIWAQVNNENTPLQESLQISYGFTFSRDKWRIDIERYIKKVSGMTSQTNGYNDQTTDFSRGEGQIFGLDILINKRFNNYRTWVNYSFTKNRFKFLDLENRFFPANHDITNYFSWSHAYKLNNYEFSIGWNYRSGNPYTAINEFRIDSGTGFPTIFLDTDNINAKRLPNYQRVDASATYSFNFSKKWKGKIGLSMLNIFNRKNILKRTFTSVPTINSNNEIIYQLEEVDRISLGLTPNLVFRISF
jgi:hypothetical protein